MVYRLATDGSDNHLVLWDMRPTRLTGSKMEKICDKVDITLNKNSIFGDRSALSPGGVRVGTPALTTRGFVESDFEQVAEFLDRAVKIGQKIQETTGPALKDFLPAIENNEELEVTNYIY